MSLKILPVKKLPEKAKRGKVQVPDPLPKPPFLLVVQAPVRSGKTNLLINLLYNPIFNFREYFDEVIYISPTIENDATAEAAMKDEKVLKVTEGLDDIDLILESIVELQKKKDKEERKETLIILDDMLGMIKNQGKSYFASLCSKYRHWKLSLIVTSQSFRALPIICRSNATGYIIFRTHNKKEFAKMEEEFEGNFPDCIDLYKDATNEKYSFLYLDQEKIRAFENFDSLLYEK